MPYDRQIPDAPIALSMLPMFIGLGSPPQLVRANMTTNFTNQEYQDCADAASLWIPIRVCADA